MVVVVEGLEVNFNPIRGTCPSAEQLDLEDVMRSLALPRKRARETVSRSRVGGILAGVLWSFLGFPSWYLI
jgi:hypothetical protein